MKDVHDKVSIIVPIYNTGTFLEQCIESIIHQTYRDLEIILVDDGSTDNSLEICNRFAMTDRRIRVIHQKNAGVSAARNHGIAVANSVWTMFVDSDDWLEPDGIERLLQTENIRNHDLILCTGYKNTRDRQVRLAPEEPARLLFEVSACKEYLMGACLMSMNSIKMQCPSEIRSLRALMMLPVMKLYRTDIIRNLRFDESVKSGEDQIFNLYNLSKINSILYLNTPIYHYRTRVGSVNNTIKNRESFYIDYAFGIDNCLRALLPEMSDRILFFRNARLCLNVCEMTALFARATNSLQDVSRYNKRLEGMCKNEFYQEALRSVDVGNIKGKQNSLVLRLVKRNLFKLAILFVYLRNTVRSDTLSIKE